MEKEKKEVDDIKETKDNNIVDIIFYLFGI